MNAREILAAAHARMSPAEIAEHALGLAELVELYHGMLDGRATAMEAAGVTVTSQVKSINNVLVEVRQINALFGLHRKVEARRRLSALAGAEMLPDPAIPDPSTYRLMPIPSALFDPSQAANNEAGK